MSVKLFSLKETKVEDLIPLREKVLGWTKPTIPADKLPTATFLTAHPKDNPCLIVGCASFGIYSLAESHQLELDALKGARIWGVAIDPKYQGQKIGSEILNYIELKLTNEKLDYMWANIRLSALNFYYAKGFNPVGEPFYDPNNGLTDQVCIKMLTRPLKP